MIELTEQDYQDLQGKVLRLENELTDAQDSANGCTIELEELKQENERLSGLLASADQAVADLASVAAPLSIEAQHRANFRKPKAA